MQLMVKVLAYVLGGKWAIASLCGWGGMVAVDSLGVGREKGGNMPVDSRDLCD